MNNLGLVVDMAQVPSRRDQHATPQHVEGLLELVPGVPLILVVGGLDIASWEPLRPRVAALLRRPITVGEIVDVVRRATP